MLYINDIITFSDKGFNNLSIEDFMDASVLIRNVFTPFLQSKGLRHVPRTAKILYNPLAYLIEKYEKLELLEREDIGLYNVNDICTLEPYYDFEEEIEQFGIQLANPMKAPYSLIGVITGWIAMREQLHNICLSLNSGVCGIVSALNLCNIDLESYEVKNGIILGAHFMGKVYEKYNLCSKIKTEFSYALLLSSIPARKYCIEILKCEVFQYSKEYLEYTLFSRNAFFFIESDCCLDFVVDSEKMYTIPYTSPQTSFLPVFLKNILNYQYLMRDENYYIIISRNSFVGCLGFKLYNYDD